LVKRGIETGPRGDVLRLDEGPDAYQETSPEHDDGDDLEHIPRTLEQRRGYPNDCGEHNKHESEQKQPSFIALGSLEQASDCEAAERRDQRGDRCTEIRQGFYISGHDVCIRFAWAVTDNPCQSIGCLLWMAAGRTVF
jgi:hypothetical protein